MNIRLAALRSLLIFALCVLVASAASAKYARPQLEKVPMERVLTNLADQAAAAPKDAKIRFNLARAYAMAYASKADEVETHKGQLWFGFEPRNVPFTLQPTDDKQEQAQAEKHLAQAIETYEAALELAPTDTVGRLGYAWALDEAGQDKLAVAEYRKVIDQAWQKERDLKSAGLGFHSLTAEAAGYLTPHLDKQKEAAELAELKRRVAVVSRIARPITPIAIPLQAGLSAGDIEDRTARVTFDADGSGRLREWTWIKPNSGWLVYDKQGTGRIDSALQLFGNVTFWMFWEHGYEPLAALDDNRNGELRGRELVGLAIWRDANQNGISDPGEVRLIGEYGIVAVSCRHTIDSEHPDRIEWSESGVVFADGRTLPTYDIRLQPRD